MSWSLEDKASCRIVRNLSELEGKEKRVPPRPCCATHDDHIRSHNLAKEVRNNDPPRVVKQPVLSVWFGKVSGNNPSLHRGMIRQYT